MRKTAAILLLAAAALCLAGCGGEKQQGDNSSGLRYQESPTDDALDWGAFEEIE